MTTVNTGGNEQVLIEQMQARIDELEETIRAQKLALDRFREHVRILQGRIDFASLPIGACGYCMAGNKPGPHHLPDCPAYKPDEVAP